jgi:hypothetical protein
MINSNYEETNQIIEKEISIIFNDYDIDELSQYEKRKKIFEYLVENITYDNDLLDIIKFNNMKTQKKFTRDPRAEFESAMKKKKGVCNGISQYYKLLLEKVGIYAFCVNCLIFYNGEPLGHQLNLVYDNESQTFSFDDVTMAVLENNRENKLGYLNFDLEEANNKKERYGTNILIGETIWQVLPEDYLNFIYNRKKTTLMEEHIRSFHIDLIMIKNNDDFSKHNINISKAKTTKKVI